MDGQAYGRSNMYRETSYIRSQPWAGDADESRSRDAQTGCDDGSSIGTVTGIVLAGTQSWGECPLERVVPRPLAPIINVPLVNHVLFWLSEAGIEHATICGNSKSKMLRASLSGDNGNGNGNGNRNAHPGAPGQPVGLPSLLKIDYYQDVAPRGPAGCVKDAGSCHHFDASVVVEGTILPTVDLGVVLRAHQESDAALTVVVSNQAAGGEADESILVPLGIYIFSRRAMDYVRPLGYQDIKETLIPCLYQCGESVLTYRTPLPAARVASVDSYLAVNEWALSLLIQQGRDPADYETDGEARIHPSASVDESARLIGPVLVGAESVIEGGVTIIGPTTVGSQSRVKDGAVVCRSALWDRATVGSQSVLDRCVVTSDAEVLPGSSHRYSVISALRRSLPRVGKWFG